MKTSILKIFSYEQKQITGILINPFFPHAMYFDNIIQFLFLIDEMLDSLNWPQESMECRLFASGDTEFTPSDQYSQEELNSIRPIAAFKINVLFRQNASWQGSVIWLDSSVESPFRSVLELIMLLDSVLSKHE